MSWFETAFGRDYLAVYPHRDLSTAKAEVEGLASRGLAAAAREGRVLDVGCGFGRHALAMRSSGFDVFGLDLSFDLLAHAAELSEAASLAGRLVRGDFRQLPFAAGSFAALTMLFSSFGYFDDGENAHVLAELGRVLVPGGLAILDLMNAERVRATLVPESWRQERGIELRERRRLTDDGRRVRKDVELARADGSVSHWHEDVRLYGLDEVRALLGAHRFEVLRVEGDFDGRPDADEAPRRIVWAQLERV